MKSKEQIDWSHGKRRSYTSIRKDVVDLIRHPPKRILDVGCSNGATGAFIKQRYAVEKIWGIEIELFLANEARKHLDEVFNFDLDQLDGNALPDNLDTIIFADVLEHTKDPAIVLGTIVMKASQDVQIIISLPNAQHWTVLWELFRGRWPLRDRGIFDKTHLRWFTFQSIVDLVQGAGLEIDEVHRNYRILDTPGRRINRYSNRFSLFMPKSFFTYQYVVRAKRRSEA